MSSINVELLMFFGNAIESSIVITLSTSSFARIVTPKNRCAKSASA